MDASFTHLMPALPGSSSPLSPARRFIRLSTVAEKTSGSLDVVGLSCDAPMRLKLSVSRLQNFRHRSKAARQNFNLKMQRTQSTTATSRAPRDQPENRCAPNRTGFL